MSTPVNKEMFVKLINDHKGIIFKVCNSYCYDRNSRQDLAQEIMYNLWKSFQSYNPQFKFSTWMYRIALNVAISSYRKEKRSNYSTTLSQELVFIEENTKDGNETEEHLGQLFTFIGALKEIDRSIILLYLDDKSNKEIAAITGITESNVSTRVNRIKDKLKSNFSTIKNKYHGTK
jgi:RNA polymerase sigma-70 factor, ECF subfamily